MKRHFHGNNQAGHVQKAKLQKQIYTSTSTQYEGTWPPEWGSFHRGTGCPLIHLQTWKSGPSRRVSCQGNKGSGDRGHLGGGSLRGLSPAHMEVGSRDLGRPISPAQLLPAPTLGCFLYQPPLVKSQKQAPGAAGCSSNTPRRSPARHNRGGSARATPAGKRSWT